MDRKGPDSLGQDAHADPHRGEVQRPLLTYVRLACDNIMDGVGEKRCIHSCLERFR